MSHQICYLDIIKRITPDGLKVFLTKILRGTRPVINHLQQIQYCICCSSTSILYSPILWDKLIKEWNLSEPETDYINRQQGIYCKRCKSSLRTMAIAFAIMRHENYSGLFKDFVNTRRMQKKHILEINKAGQLTQFLNSIPKHVLGSYPDIDIQNMNYSDSSFDMVVHSDTLEHVPDPGAALRECARVLKPEGYCVFTIPIVLERLTISREGMAPSYHGSERETGDDYLVHTEYGADAWKYALEAGFREVRIFALEYPAALALLCRK